LVLNFNNAKLPTVNVLQLSNFNYYSGIDSFSTNSAFVTIHEGELNDIVDKFYECVDSY